MTSFHPLWLPKVVATIVELEYRELSFRSTDRFGSRSLRERAQNTGVEVLYPEVVKRG